MLKDYGIEQGSINLHYDNSSAISILKNPVFHSCTKHIEIRHHFIRDLVKEKIVSLEFVSTEHQLIDILTKPLDFLWFEYLRKSSGICLIKIKGIGSKVLNSLSIFCLFPLAFFLLAWAYDFCFITWYISIICNTSSLWTREIYYIYKTWCEWTHRYLLITIDVIDS